MIPPALDVPSWSYLEREPLPVAGPYAVRPSRMGYTWLVTDTRTGFVVASKQTREAAESRADELNRRAP